MNIFFLQISDASERNYLVKMFLILLLLLSCRSQSQDQKNKTQDNLTSLLTGLLD